DAQIGNNVRPLDPSKVASEDLTTGDEGASCFSCALPDAPIGKMYQPSWDGWERCILTLHTLAQLVGTYVNMFNLTKLEHTLSLFLEEAVKGELESLFVDKVIANLGLCISVYDTESIYASFIFANEGAPTDTEFVEDERSKLQWISAWCNFS
ncbi:DNA-directed RNA polymerase III subunit RPC8, partial [Tanacetum coccineum]